MSDGTLISILSVVVSFMLFVLFANLLTYLFWLGVIAARRIRESFKGKVSHE